MSDYPLIEVLRANDATAMEQRMAAETIEQLQDKVNQWERWWFECDASDDPPYQPDYPAPPEDKS